MTTLHPALFWLLLVFATFGLVCFLVPLFFFFWIVRQVWKEEKAKRLNLKHLKKQLSSIDALYR